MITSTSTPYALGVLMTAAVLSGCGGGGGPSQLGIVAPTQQRIAVGVEHRTPFSLLQMQAKGKIPGPFPVPVLRQQLKQIEGHPRPHLDVHGDAAQVGIWTTASATDYLLGQSADGRKRKTLVAIDVEPLDCYDPIGVKVDDAQNVWVACAYNSNASASKVLEYNRAGTLEQTYNWQPCPPSASFCFTDGYDAAFDSKGHVFASVAFYNYAVSSQEFAGAGFEWWNVKSPNSPTLISTGDRCSPVCSLYFMDVDSSGNIWFNYSGVVGSQQGYGLAEITNPTTNPQIVYVLPIGTYQFAGGVYVSNAGKTLNVTDEMPRLIYQYHLPVKPNSKPFNVLGPTAPNGLGLGSPSSGGFNRSETRLVQADGYGWLDIGIASDNTWTRVQNPAGNFALGLGGAAYTPSDK
jgi:hypothetical protein